jgi:hypothetical protein
MIRLLKLAGAVLLVAFVAAGFGPWSHEEGGQVMAAGMAIAGGTVVCALVVGAVTLTRRAVAMTRRRPAGLPAVREARGEA